MLKYYLRWVGFVFSVNGKHGAATLKWHLETGGSPSFRHFDPTGMHSNVREKAAYGNYCISRVLRPLETIKSLQSSSPPPAFTGAAPGWLPQGPGLPHRPPCPKMAAWPRRRLPGTNMAAGHGAAIRLQVPGAGGRGGRCSQRPCGVSGGRQRGGGRSWRCPGMTPSGGAGAARSR